MPEPVAVLLVYAPPTDDPANRPKQTILGQVFESGPPRAGVVLLRITSDARVARTWAADLQAGRVPAAEETSDPSAAR
jgi:hypothetical protein